MSNMFPLSSRRISVRPRKMRARGVRLIQMHWIEFVGATRLSRVVDDAQITRRLAGQLTGESPIGWRFLFFEY